jgi:hypothetical protein
VLVPRTSSPTSRSPRTSSVGWASAPCSRPGAGSASSPPDLR